MRLIALALVVAGLLAGCTLHMIPVDQEGRLLQPGQKFGTPTWYVPAVRFGLGAPDG